MRRDDIDFIQEQKKLIILIVLYNTTWAPLHQNFHHQKKLDNQVRTLVRRKVLIKRFKDF